MLYGPKRTFDRRIAGQIGNKTGKRIVRRIDKKIAVRIGNRTDSRIDSKTGRWNTNSIVRITIAETAEVIGKVRNQPNGSRANL